MYSVRAHKIAILGNTLESARLPLLKGRFGIRHRFDIKFLI